MKKKYLIANWKLYLDVRQSQSMARSLRKFRSLRSVTTVLCPSALALPEVAEILGRQSFVQIGMQSIGVQEEGAATGELSARDAKELGCRYVIVGHSERRAKGETDAVIAKKINLADHSGLIPILCVGESAQQHKAGRTFAVIESQLSHALKTFHGKKLIITYEPVWAISKAGKGKSCPPETAFATAGILQKYLRSHFRSLRVTLLYGGSVSSNNIADYVDSAHFFGALVGFASTKAAEMRKMAKEIS